MFGVVVTKHFFVSDGHSGHAKISAVLPVSLSIIKKKKLVNCFNCTSAVMVNV